MLCDCGHSASYAFLLILLVLENRNFRSLRSPWKVLEFCPFSLLWTLSIASYRIIYLFILFVSCNCLSCRGIWFSCEFLRDVDLSLCVQAEDAVVQFCQLSQLYGARGWLTWTVYQSHNWITRWQTMSPTHKLADSDFANVQTCQHDRVPTPENLSLHGLFLPFFSVDISCGGWSYHDGMHMYYRYEYSDEDRLDWILFVCLQFLPVYVPSEAEKKDASLFARNVRAVMAK